MHSDSARSGWRRPKCSRREAAHGQAADMRAGNAEAVEHGQDVVGGHVLAVGRGLLRHVGWRVAAGREADRAVAAAEMVQLQRPAAVVAGELVNEDQRRAVPGFLYEQLYVVRRGREAHVVVLSEIRWVFRTSACAPTILCLGAQARIDWPLLVQGHGSLRDCRVGGGPRPAAGLRFRYPVPRYRLPSPAAAPRRSDAGGQTRRLLTAPAAKPSASAATTRNSRASRIAAQAAPWRPGPGSRRGRARTP